MVVQNQTRRTVRGGRVTNFFLACNALFHTHLDTPNNLSRIRPAVVTRFPPGVNSRLFLSRFPEPRDLSISSTLANILPLFPLTYARRFFIE